MAKTGLVGTSFPDIIWKYDLKCTNYLQYFNVKLSNINLLCKFLTIWTLFNLLKTKLVRYLDASCSVFFVHDLNSRHDSVLECLLCDMSVMWSLIWLEAFYENLKKLYCNLLSTGELFLWQFSSILNVLLSDNLFLSLFQNCSKKTFKAKNNKWSK